MPAFTRTLRFRLMLWNAGVVLFTAVLVLFGLREGVRRALVHELDAILREDLGEVRLSLHAAGGPLDANGVLDENLRSELTRKAQGHRAHEWFVRLLAADGTPLWSSFSAPDPMVPADGPQNRPFGSLNYRLAQARLNTPRGPVAGIRVGASTGMIDEDVARLDRLVGVAALVVLVFAPPCGYWLAGRALRPVAGIIDTAARLRPGLLDERLPDRGTGDELDKLAVTINSLLDRIAAHLAERRDFLANSAHELRSPLAAIRSTVEVALQGGRLSRADEEPLAVVIDQCRSLEHLVNQLLLIAETEAERLQVRAEGVRFDQKLLRTADMFSAVAELKEVTLTVPPPAAVLVHGNRHHLRQVLNNLLDNAVKFTPPGGTVTATLTFNPTAGTATLIVTDTGEGIPAADLPRVFDRFFRGDRARVRDAGRGTGLGLSICHAVITAHGGTITAVSQPGHGTTFTVTLPAAAVRPTT